MNLELNSIIILTILTLNLLVIFIIKSRVNMIIFINTSNLVTILLYSLTIENFLLLKELSIATIIYSIIISFLIVSKDAIPSRAITNSKINISLLSIIILICALSSFYALRNVNTNLEIKKEKYIKAKILKSTQETESNHSNFIYLQNKNTKDHILFNRFGDFIIIICAIVAFLFLGTKHQKE